MTSYFFTKHKNDPLRGFSFLHSIKKLLTNKIKLFECLERFCNATYGPRHGLLDIMRFMWNAIDRAALCFAAARLYHSAACSYLYPQHPIYLRLGERGAFDFF
jgi:hypothetical protein